MLLLGRLYWQSRCTTVRCLRHPRCQDGAHRAALKGQQDAHMRPIGATVVA